jgi:hypothetical protein
MHSIANLEVMQAKLQPVWPEPTRLSDSPPIRFYPFLTLSMKANVFDARRYVWKDPPERTNLTAGISNLALLSPHQGHEVPSGPDLLGARHGDSVKSRLRLLHMNQSPQGLIESCLNNPTDANAMVIDRMLQYGHS